jgi:hypothetical protein
MNGNTHPRDARKHKRQKLEASYLAPDSVNEMFSGLEMLEYFTGKAPSLMKKTR